MKKKLFMIVLIFSVLTSCQNNKTEIITDTKNIGMSTTELSYDMLNGRQFDGLKHNGYSAEVIHMEYLPGNVANVFMSYAIYGDGNYQISIYQNIEDTYHMILGKWSLNENQKTGVISFCVKQQEKVDLVFETKIISDLPSSFSEPFSLSTIKKKAVVLSSK